MEHKKQRLLLGRLPIIIIQPPVAPDEIKEETSNHFMENRHIAEPANKYIKKKENIVPPSSKVSRKRLASDSSVIETLSKWTRFYKKKKRVKSMGSACTKGARIIDGREETSLRQKLSPSRNGKVAPMMSNNVDEEKHLKRQISMDSIAIQSKININLGDDTVFSNNKENISPVSTDIEVFTITKDNNKVSCINKQKPSSLPDLRQKNHHQMKSRSKSLQNTGALMKSSHGSANLLEKKDSVFVLRDDPLHESHSSSIDLMKIPRRKSRPTLENTIHVLEGDKVNYYQLMDEIGRGSFGAVYRCKSFKDNCPYAMKIISKNRLMRTNRMRARRPGKLSKNDPLEPLHREIAILKKMDHPYVVKLIEVIDDIQVDDVYMVFELMPHGEVMKVPTETPLHEDRARRLFRELVLGIEYLHYSKIVHRDIKPSNLLLDENDHIKIADFGVSNMFEGDDDLINKYAGSPAFQAPEVLNYESRDKYSGKAVDVWAMGVTLYCFLYGKCPFYSNNIGELRELIKEQPLTFPDEPDVNPQAIDLISRLLAKQPKERITVLETKKHPWVTEGGLYVLPATEDHCKMIEVTEEEVRNSIKIISKLSSIVEVKAILKGKSFRRPSKPWKRNHSLPDKDNHLGIS